MSASRQFNTPVNLNSAALAATHNSNTVANVFTTGGNVGIGTTAPAYTLDVIGTIDATFYTGSNISISGSITSSTLRVTGNADLSTGLTTVTDLTGTNITSGTIRASTLISTSNLSTNNLTSTNLLATASTITNLSIPGTLTVVNITSTNLVETNITAGGIVVTGGSLRATFNSNTIGNIFTTGGNVGIGTTNPSSKLTVIGSETTTNGENSAILIQNTAATSGNKWWLRTGAVGTSTPVGGFSIADTSAYRMVIASNGNVGIGTTSPSTLMHLHNPSLPKLTLSRYTTNTSGGNLNHGELVWKSLNRGNDNAIIRCTSQSGPSLLGWDDAGRLEFLTQAGAATPSIQMVIAENGNVGIGTTNPAYTLDVNGTIDATSYTGTNLGVTNITVGTLRTTTLITTANLAANNISGGTIRSNTGTITTGNIILTNTIGGGVIQFNDDAHTIYGRMGLNGVIDQMQIREYGQIQFWTGGLLGSQVNRMTIASNGNISMAGAALNNTGFNFPTGGYGIHWQTGSSGVSRIFDDGDLRICTDDNMRFYTGSNASTPGTERITLNSTGVGVFSNSIVSLLCVNGDAGGNGALQVVSVSSSVNSGRSQDGASFKAWNDGNNILQFYNSAGGYRGGVNGSGSGAVTYATSSDRRLKENVINITNATQMIKQMRPVEFTWKSDNRQDFGFIAQEVFDLLPSLRPNFTNYSHCECTPEELSHGILCNCEEHDHDEPIDKDGKPLYYGLDYGKFTPYLTKALQETISELEASQQTIQNQESIITQLQSQLAAQQQQINDILTRLG